MQEIVIMKGLPGSGKTSHALELLKKNPGKYVRINKDDLRQMLHGGEWSEENEKYIILARDILIKGFIRSGFDVIVDDTNFADKHTKRIEEISSELKDKDGITITIQQADFTQVPLETCVKNDLKRQRSVGKDVIVQMFNKYIRKNEVAPVKDPSLPDALIIDIDGTISHMTNRSPFDYTKVDSDRKDEVIHDIISRFPEYHIIFVSGREASCKEMTIKWLEDNKVLYNEIYMRKEGDKRKDVEVKKEIYETHIKGKYNVHFVLDDRQQVVDGWRALGLKCLQVSDGQF